MPKSSKKHYFSKRFAQLGQQFRETYGKEVTKTELTNEYCRLETISKSMRENYEKMGKKAENFLDPENGPIDLKTSKYNRMFLVGRDRLGQLAKVFNDSGNSIGENSTLGSAYLMCSDAEQAVTASWLDFETESVHKFLKPLQGSLKEQLKSIDAAVKKVQSDRLYLDAKKYKAATARKAFKNYDSSIIVHREKKVSQLEEKLGGEVESSLSQMFQFFYECEDSQLNILCDFISAQREFYRSAFEILAELGDDLELLKCQPMQSVAGHQRNIPILARALYDYTPTKPDELPLVAGEVINVVLSNPSVEGWLDGSKFDGSSGLVPSNFVQVMTPDEQLLYKKSAQMIPSNYGLIIPATEPFEYEPIADSSQNRVPLEYFDSPSNVNALPQSVNSLEYVCSACDRAGEEILQILKDLSLFGLEAQKSNFEVTLENFDESKDSLLSTAQNLMQNAKSVLKCVPSEPVEMVNSIHLAVDNFYHLNADCKKTVGSILEPRDRQNLLGAAQGIIQSFFELIENAKVTFQGDPQGSAQVKKASKSVVASISSFLDTMSFLKQNQPQSLQDESFSKEDSSLAEAGEAIQNSEKVLNFHKKRIISEEDDDFFRITTEDSIIEDCREIAHAGTLLIQAARKAQQAIHSAGLSVTTSQSAYNSHSSFVGGLVGAAKEVASCIVALCEAADCVLKGQKSIDVVIGGAQSVAAASSRVVMSSANKNPDRGSQDLLFTASRQIDAASMKLVDRVNKYHQELCDDVQSNWNPSTYASSKAAELDARAKISEMERQLLLAQKQLQSINEQTYQNPKPASLDFGSPSGVGKQESASPSVGSTDDDLLARLSALRSKK